MKPDSKRKLKIYVAAVAMLALAAYEIFFSGKIFPDPLTPILDVAITRALATVIALIAVDALGYNILHKFNGGSLVAVLPCFAAVICNPPLLGLIDGNATLSYFGFDAAAYIALFALECLCVGAFEEILFRGGLFLVVLEKHRSSKKQVFISVLLSSAAFAIVHLFNLINSSPVSVIMQVGYSFLLGCACSFTLLKTGNVLPCITLHAAFNFCGSLIDVLGTGNWSGIPLTILSACVCVIVAVYVIASFFKSSFPSTDAFYPLSNKFDD